MLCILLHLDNGGFDEISELIEDYVRRLVDLQLELTTASQLGKSLVLRHLGWQNTWSSNGNDLLSNIFITSLLFMVCYTMFLACRKSVVYTALFSELSASLSSPFHLPNGLSK